MKKGLVLLLLVGALTASLFGCGKKSDASADNTTTEASEEKDNKEDSKEDSKEEKKEASESKEKTEEDDLSKYDLSQGVTVASYDVDVNGIADTLKTNIEYQDELMEVSLDKASMFYDFSNVNIVEACIYESSGATAEEIVVLKCGDSQSVAAAKEVLENRVTEQIESFKDYVPEEVTKLKSAVIITNSDFAILSVSDNSDSAKQLIEGMLAQ